MQSTRHVFSRSCAQPIQRRQQTVKRKMFLIRELLRSVYCAVVRRYATYDACRYRSGLAGILRNISPIPPPSIAATVDLDRDVVLPTLEPVLASIDLQEAAQTAQHAIDNQVHKSLIIIPT